MPKSKNYYLCEGCSNLPEWASASAVYSKAYRVLESMALRHASMDDRRRLIEALDKGDEEVIKGLLLMTHVYY